MGYPVYHSIVLCTHCFVLNFFVQKVVLIETIPKKSFAVTKTQKRGPKINNNYYNNHIVKHNVIIVLKLYIVCVNVVCCC